MPDAPSDASGSPARPRGRRWRIALVLLAIAVLAAFGLLSGLDGWVQQTLQRMVVHELAGELSFGQFRLDLWRMQASFSDLRLRIPRGNDGSLRIHIRRGHARLKVSSLLGFAAGQARLSELRLEQPHLEWERASGGTEQVRRDLQARAIDLRIEHMEVLDGRLLYSEHSPPWSFDASEVSLEAAWSNRARALVGDASLRMEVRRPPFVRPLALSIRSGFELRRHDVALEELVVQGPGLTATLSSNIRLFAPLAAVGHGRVDIDLEQLQPLLDPELPTLAGRLAGPVSLDWGAGQVGLRGRLEADDPRFGILAADAARAIYRYANGKLEVVEFEAQAYDGTVSGTFETRFGEAAEFQARVEGRAVDATALLAAFDVPLPLQSLVDFELSLAGAAGQRSDWRGRGGFTARQAPAARGEIPVRGRGELELSGGRLATRARLELASSEIQVEIGVGLNQPREGRIAIEGTTDHARNTQLAVWLLADSLGLSLPAMARRRLDGAGCVSAVIVLGGNGPLSVGLELSDGRWSGRSFDHAELELEVAGDDVSIGKLAWTHGAERVAGSARFQADPFSLHELDLATEALDLEWVLASAGLDVDISGRLDVSLKVGQPEGEGRHGAGRLRLVEGRVFGEPFEEILADVEVRRDGVRLSSLVLAGPVAEGLASLEWSPHEGRWAITLERARVRLESLEAIRSRQLPLEGELELGGELRLGRQTMDGELTLTGRDWRYKGRLLGSPHGTATLADGRLKAQLVDHSGWSSTLDLQLDVAAPFSAQIALEEKIIDFVEHDPDHGWARITGRAAIEGALGRPETLNIRGVVDQLALQWAGEWLETAGPVKVSLHEGHLEVSSLRLIGPDTDLELDLSYAIDEDRLQASAQGHLDLGVVRASWPDLIVSGQVDLDLEAHGALGAPVLGGSVWAENGRVRWRGLPQSLDQISFRLHLDGQRAVLESLRGRLGNGEVRATGSVVFEGFALDSYEVAADFAHVRLLEPEGFRGDVEGRVTLTGTAANATIGGEVTLLRGVYDKDFDLERFGRGGVRQSSTAGPSELPANVFLDLHLIADGNLWVRNDLAEIESSFDLHLGGSLSRPEVTGRVGMIEGGTLEFRDVEYELRTGSLDFVELERINPYLTLRADTRVREYTIYLRVEGTLEQFEYELTSEPSLATQDIIALLTTGNTLEEITGSSGGAAVGGDVAANYFSGAFSAGFEKRLERLLGLQKVRIDPLLAAGESDPTTRLTLGQEVLDDVLVVFSTDLSDNENQLYAVDWRMTRRFRLGARRDTRGGVGGEVRYADRFWWRKPPTPSVQTAPTRSRPHSGVPDGQAVVASVGIVGAEPVDSAPLRALVALEPGQVFSRSVMFGGVEAIKRYYVRAGKIETQVDATVGTTETGVTVVYSVLPSPRIAVEFRGTTRKQERQLRPILETLWIESVFSQELYDDAVDRLREFFHARGHYAADVRWHAERIEGQRRVLFEVEAGEPVRVARVTIRGVQQISERRVRAQMLTRPATLLQRQPLTPEVLEDDVAAIRSLYRNEGFLEVRVARPRILLSSSADSAEVELEIEEGPRCTVSDVRFPPDLPFSIDEMLVWAGLEPGQVFSPAALLKAESRLRAGVDAKGYPDARVQGRVELAGALARVSFDVNPGGLKRVGEISIRGHRLTQDKVIRRELELAAGELISRASLLRTQHQLYQLGIFRNVSLSYAPMDPDDPTVQRLEVRLEESAPLSTTVGVGYDTEADARVNFSLTNDNLAGYDRVLSVQGKFSGLERRLVLVGKEPRLFNHRLYGLGSVGWEEVKEEGFKQEVWSAAFRAAKRLNAKWNAFARYAFQFVELFDVEIPPEELEKERLVDGRLGNFGIGFARDTRDNPFLPTRGTSMSFGARLFARPLVSEYTFIKGQFGFSHVKGFKDGSSVASGVRIGLAFPFGSTEAVPISEAFFAGGDSTIRGFVRDTVGPATGGEAMLILNEEFRFPIWRDLKGVIFYDAGNVYAQFSDFDPTDLRHVLGVGLRLETAIGPVRVEYGRKLDREPGESTGELFLSFGSAF